MADDRRLNEIAQRALRLARGDPLTAVKLLRDETDLGLLAALEVIKAALHQRGRTVIIVRAPPPHA